MTKQWLKYVGATALILGLGVAHVAAQPRPQELGVVVGAAAVMSDVDLSEADDADRTTSVMYTAGRQVLVTWFNFTKSAADDFSLKCFASRDGSEEAGAFWSALQTIGATGTSSDSQPTMDVSGLSGSDEVEVPWRWDVRGYPYTRCTAYSTGADSSDRATIYQTMYGNPGG